MASSFICIGLGIMVCFPQDQAAIPANSFCQVYQRILRSGAEGVSLATVPLAVRQRIAANETLYRCHCEGWQNPICAKNQTTITMMARR